MLGTTKKASWWLIGVVLFVDIALKIWINLYGFRGGLLDVKLFSGLINSTLVANLLLLAVVVVGLLFGLGRLRPSDVGVYQRQILPALLGGVIFWAGLQLVAFLVTLVSGSLAVNPLWHDEGGAAAVGYLIEQLFGNAFYEEIVFRGFLFVQLLLCFNRLARKWVGFTLALVVSQAVFALMHLPNRIWADNMTLPDAFSSIESVFVLGVLFALVYWRTRNLLLVVAIHALSNEPTSIVMMPNAVLGYTTQLVMVGLILFWPRPSAIQPANAQPN